MVAEELGIYGAVTVVVRYRRVKRVRDPTMGDVSPRKTGIVDSGLIAYLSSVNGGDNSFANPLGACSKGLAIDRGRVSGSASRGDGFSAREKEAGLGVGWNEDDCVGLSRAVEAVGECAGM